VARAAHFGLAESGARARSLTATSTRVAGRGSRAKISSPAASTSISGGAGRAQIAGRLSAGRQASQPASQPAGETKWVRRRGKGAGIGRDEGRQSGCLAARQQVGQLYALACAHLRARLAPAGGCARARCQGRRRSLSPLAVPIRR